MTILPISMVLTAHQIGFTIGFMAKILLVIGLYHALTESSKIVHTLRRYSDQLFDIIHVAFHELDIPLKGLDKTCTSLLENTDTFRYSNSVAEKIQNMHKAILLNRAILHSYGRMYSMLDEDQKLEAITLDAMQDDQSKEIYSVNVNHVIHSVVSPIKISKPKLDFTIEYSKECDIECRASDLYIILRNIITNAE